MSGQEIGAVPSPDPHVICRSAGAALCFGDPGLQIPQTFRGDVCAFRWPLHLQSAHLWSVPPTSTCNGLLSGVPKIHSHQASRENGEGYHQEVWALPSCWHPCLPPLSFLPWWLLGAPSSPPLTTGSSSAMEMLSELIHVTSSAEQGAFFS